MDHAEASSIPTETIQSFLDQMAPGSRFRSMHLLAASFSNYNHLVEFDSSEGTRQRIVVRRYNPAGGSMANKASHEFTTLAWLHNQGLPVARPLFLDPDGALLGSPGFAMTFLTGQPLLWPDHPPRDPIQWAVKSAEMLARIHLTPCEPVPDFLLNNNEFALYFLTSGEIPAYLSADPDGPAIWNAILAHIPHFEQSSKSIIHLDYWSGNLLWNGDQISGVVDWEEAGYGEPGIDVGYALMDILLVGEPRAAEAFLSTYECITGGKVAHLAFWELAAAVRPIQIPEGWIAESPFQERFRKFVADGMRNVSSP